MVQCGAGGGEEAEVTVGCLELSCCREAEGLMGLLERAVAV